MALLGISGKIGSGKDTVANMLHYFLRYNKYDDWNVEFHPEDIYGCPGWETKRFAEKLKQRIALTWNVDRDLLEDREFKESISPLGITWRKLMQLEGEKMREINSDYWVDALFADYQKVSLKWDSDGNTTVSGYPNWLIADLRFENEADAIIDRNGTLIRVNRPCNICGVVGYHKLNCGNNSSHPSEISLDDFKGWNHVITNDGSLEDLLNKVKEICKEEKII